MPSIFLNYRSSDVKVALALFDALSDILDVGDVFAAQRSVEPGQKYGGEIEKALTRADLFFSIIGLNWLSLADRDGIRLIDKGTDWVHREILHAFSRRIPVVPILLHGARFPAAADLPDPLKELSELQYMELDAYNGNGLAEIISYVAKKFPYSTISSSNRAWNNSSTIAPTGGLANLSPRSDPDSRRRVFVIHGRDMKVKELIFSLLRELDLNPQEWEPLVKATGNAAPSVIDVVTKGLSVGRAQAVVALLTPDDVVTLHPGLRQKQDPPHETAPALQPRPNVLLELGIALSVYREQTIIVEFGQLRTISDLAGLDVVRFNGTGAAIGKIVERLKLAGCAVKDAGSDWRRTKRFTGLDAYKRQPVISSTD